MDRVQIQQLAGLYGSPVERLHAANVLLRCPAYEHHNNRGRGSPTLSVKVEPLGQSLAHCFSCNIAGSLGHVFAEAANLGVGGLETAIAFIADNDKGGFAAAMAKCRSMRVGDQEEHRLGVAQGDLERYVTRCSRMVPRYLIEQRGIVAADVQKWQLGFDDERLRAVFPVRDERRRLVGASLRTVLPEGEDPPKYLNTPGFEAKNYFYGEQFVDPTIEEGRLVEGPVSEIYAARVLPNVLGMFGTKTGVGPVRLAKLRRWFRKITLILDNDDAGREAVYGWLDAKERWHPGLRDVLREHFVVRVATLPDREDPASITADALVAADRSATYLGW